MRRACFSQARRLPAPLFRHTTNRPAGNQSRSFRYVGQRLQQASASKSDLKPNKPSSTKTAITYESFPLDQFERIVKDPTSKYQIYISFHENPFANLAVEQYLFQNSPPDSTILFLYNNGPCVVIGRNQNPWLEANLAQSYKQQNAVPLVRRRSGGGAVFHDRGNLNFSVICPSANFTRDKHAQMVASALRSLGVDGARVNDRHDIVVEQGDPPATFKISGSAYKLTRQRALHHGTLLINTDAGLLRNLLKSPAIPFIKARGVESVKSAVTNIQPIIPPDTNSEAKMLSRLAIIREFANLYKLNLPLPYPNFMKSADKRSSLHVGDEWVMGDIPKEGWRPVEQPEYNQSINELKVIPIFC
jgi:lipoate---protein ligase